jgi:hypothetical protein
MMAIQKLLEASVKMISSKTFHVMLFHPYGSETWSLVSKDMYSFNIHASDLQEAAKWVERVFPGIDVYSKSVREYKVGCADPVHIIDCDELKKYGFVNGKRVPVETPEGYFRRTPKEIVSGLFKLFNTINHDYNECLNIAEYSSQMYEKFKLEYYLERINVAKEAAKLASTWMSNLMKEYLTLQQSISVSI